MTKESIFEFLIYDGGFSLAGALQMYILEAYTIGKYA